jgi:hypothetical protein
MFESLPDEFNSEAMSVVILNMLSYRKRGAVINTRAKAMIEAVLSKHPEEDGFTNGEIEHWSVIGKGMKLPQRSGQLNSCFHGLTTQLKEGVAICYGLSGKDKEDFLKKVITKEYLPYFLYEYIDIPPNPDNHKVRGLLA